ncbi:MAG: esterase/lipase family protein [Rubripirellula sp.]
MRISQLIGFVCLLTAVSSSKSILAQESQSAQQENSVVPAEKEPEPKPRWNLPIKTAGGTQVWTDHLYRAGTRIQQNELTGHWRLLDADDIRRAWGTRRQCEVVLEQIQPNQANSGSKHTVVLLHGLMRTRHSMKALETRLTKSESIDVIRFSYASTRGSIGDHATALREILEDLPADATFSFVGHSMGNIVVRHLIGDLQQYKDPTRILDRCQSMVMLGPPNQGAAIARRLAPSGLYGLVTGKGGMELGPEWDNFVKNLATPPFPFAIIAGDVSKNTIQNPLVDGSSDFVVSVEEAQLDGCEQFETVPVLHSFLMDDAKALELTTAFIQSHRSERK